MKNADGVRNLATIVEREEGELVVVVSAMGKTTNLLETLCDAYFHRRGDTDVIMRRLREYHRDIMRELFAADDAVYRELEELLALLDGVLAGESAMCYDYEYDRIVSFGELISTTIVSAYLRREGVDNRFVDVRRCLKTDASYRNANVDLELSGALCRGAQRGD